MKKVVALLCVLFVLVPTCFAEETSDYSYLDSMGVEELMKLRIEVDSRLAQGGLYEANSIPPGDYVVGTDIKAGTYVVKNMYAHDPSKDWPRVSVYASLEEAKNNGTTLEWFSMNLGDEHLVRLEDGQCLHIACVTVYLFDTTSDEVKKSWQP